MKKLVLLLAGLFLFTTLQAQWVNNPAQNTFIANTSADAGEIYLATNTNTGDTYLQWCSFVGGNGWSPTLQRLNSEGVPQWGLDGIHISAYEFSSSSEGVAMTTTTDGGVVSCFAVYDGYTCAVKINPDGTFPWGEQGVQLFGGLGFSRAEVIATDDGGIWALGFDYSNLYLQYLNNTAGPVITISDIGGRNCMYGQLTLGNDNKVFVTYEKVGSGFYTDKEIYVAGYNPDGTQFSPETMLMSSQTFQVTYLHYAISDGMGGGYVYIWHPALYNFNVYVFHFNQNGASTIMDPNGVPVHSPDNNNLYTGASATVDPDSHDIILFYEQTDDYSQSQCKLYMNRITPDGERLWGDGILVLDNGTTPCGGLNIDAFEYGGGFAVSYFKGIGQTAGSQATVEAQGFDMNGNTLWNTQLCSNTYNKTGCEYTTGFHGGQNIIAWVNSTDAVIGGGPGGLYGQNFGQNGEMGEITPPTPPTPCYAPTNFQCEYIFDTNTQQYGAQTSWDAPRGLPIRYNLYRQDLNTLSTVIIEVAPDVLSYFDATGIGDFKYQLTAVYENGESDFALTPSGENYVFIEVTSIPENEEESIVTVLKIYNIKGQLLKTTNTKELRDGVYIIQGLTNNGKLINKKTLISQ
jgi:hypothetical protein